ncbi:MAG: peptidoglycan DD-metalloendopeptidase family protein [Thiobacillaceae bacterium]
MRQRLMSLTQRLGLPERKLSLRWMVAGSILPFLGVVTAFGIAPDTQTQTQPRHLVAETLAVSIQTPPPNALEFTREDKVQPGETIAGLLARMQVSDEDTQRIMSGVAAEAGLNRLRSGQTLQSNVMEDGSLVNLSFVDGDGQTVTIKRQAGAFAVDKSIAALETRVVMRSGKIQSSLYAASDAAGLPDSVTDKMAELFSTDIDFHQDLRKGDTFSVIYSQNARNGQLLGDSKVLAAEFVNAGKVYRAVLFRDALGHEDYYTPDGQSLKKAFLRSPLPFSRITSGFTMARFHPILKKWRAHKGIDYAAPSGTPVKSMSDGTIEFIGRQHGYGNLLVIKHFGPYSTAYGHLSRFATGLHRGSHVSQGQIVAFVGMTGLATGPHLHYEFRVNGVQRNPLAMNLPISQPLSTSNRARFAQTAQPWIARLNLIRGTNLAALD